MDTIHLNMNNMKKYVINLKRRPDRLEYFKQVCPYDNIEIFPAFDGKHIDANIRGLDFYRIFKARSAQLCNGAIGCFISHMLIWKKIVADNHNYTMIFEDDAIFSDQFTEIIDKIDLSYIDSILYIGGRFTPNYIMRNSIPITDVLIKHDLSKRWDPMDCDRGTFAYILTKNCAKILLESFDKMFNGTDPVDYYIIRCVLGNKMNIYNSKPLLCHSPAASPDSDIR
jgi:glycosyl transferase, family 25